ncbi:protein phosphatase 1 regulatory subunit 17 [Eucyclogobius newberryi]|uniref:protein phosphatase 1 regulatory subunit 17 n=1 Tax=Eucyclogobius newberryi TaxID=166745 RepID=UPI003B5B3AD6
MTTGCVRATLEPEHNFQDLSEDPEALSPEPHPEDQLKKPRRKDTPVLTFPPHIPGVRQMKVETKVVYLEDQEKHVGN